MSMPQVWFITGANRGLGYAIATAAIGAGHQVVATARDAESLRAALGESDNVLIEELDITDEQQARTVTSAAVNRFGPIDVLVSNAGFDSSACSRRPRSISSDDSSRPTPSAR